MNYPRKQIPPIANILLFPTIRQAISDLKRIKDNLKKSIYKQISKDTLESNLNLAKELKEVIENCLDEKFQELPSNEFNEICKQTRDIYWEICTITKRKLASSDETPKMPPPEENFDLKNAIALVQPYDGSPQQMEAFVDAVSLLSELIKPDQMLTATKFVKTRLSGRARLALPTNVATLQGIIDAVSNNCKSTESPDTVLAKLNRLRYTRAENFLEQVEALSTQLTTMYIQSKIPTDVATKMATKAGVDALINGITDNETKIILKANEFSTIQSAIQKVNENIGRSAQVLTVNARRGLPRKNNCYNNNRGNYCNNYGNRGYNRNSYNNRQSRTNYNEGYNQRNHYSPRGRGNFHNNRGFTHNSTQNNQRNPRVYYTQSNQHPTNQQPQLVPNIAYQQPSTLQTIPQSGAIQHLQPHPLGGIQGQFTQ